MNLCPAGNVPPGALQLPSGAHGPLWETVLWPFEQRLGSSTTRPNTEVCLQPQNAAEIPGGLLKHRLLGFTPVIWGPQMYPMYISDKFPEMLMLLMLQDCLLGVTAL